MKMKPEFLSSKLMLNLENYLTKDFEILLRRKDEFSYSNTTIKHLIILSQNMPYPSMINLCVFMIAIGKEEKFSLLGLESERSHIQPFFSYTFFCNLEIYHPEGFEKLDILYEKIVTNNCAFYLWRNSIFYFKSPVNRDTLNGKVFDRVLEYYENNFVPKIFRLAQDIDLIKHGSFFFSRFVFEAIFSNLVKKSDHVAKIFVEYCPFLLEQFSSVFMEYVEVGHFHRTEFGSEIDKVKLMKYSGALRELLSHPQMASMVFKNNVEFLDVFYDVKRNIRDNPEFFIY